MYTLGNSPLFLLLSHEIAKLSHQPKDNIPNLILLLNDPLKLQRFLKNDSRILVRGNKEPIFQYMAACTPPTLVTEDKLIIENLVMVERNRRKLVSNLRLYKESLNDTSNLLLVNPPMGTVDILQNDIWQNNERNLMPKIFIGLTAKDEELVNYNKWDLENNLIFNPLTSSTDPIREFSLNLNPLFWKDKIRLLVTALPHQVSLSEDTSLLEITGKPTNDMIEVVSRLGKFDTSMINFIDFHFLRLEKTIIDSCIESLAVLYDCKHIQDLLLVPKSEVLLKCLIREQIYIIMKSYPYLVKAPNFNVILDENRIYELITMKLNDSYIKSNAFKDMLLLDVKSINDLNGYFINLGNKNNVNCKWNKILNWLLKGKTAIRKHAVLRDPYM